MLRSFTMKVVTFPIHEDIAKIPVMMKTSPFIPAIITEVDVHIIAAEQNGQEIADHDVYATKVMELDEITERVNSLKSTWKAQAPVKSGDVVSHVGENPREHDEPPRGGMLFKSRAL